MTSLVYDLYAGVRGAELTSRLNAQRHQLGGVVFLTEVSQLSVDIDVILIYLRLQSFPVTCVECRCQLWGGVSVGVSYGGGVSVGVSYYGGVSVDVSYGGGVSVGVSYGGGVSVGVSYGSDVSVGVNIYMAV